MQFITRILILSLALQSFQCDDNNSSITPQQLAEKKLEILDYIQSFSCTGATDCNAIAFGAKPCGGPKEFLAYPNTVDQTILQEMVDTYYAMEQQYNLETNAVSDCMAVGPPNTIECVAGVCTIIN